MAFLTVDDVSAPTIGLPDGDSSDDSGDSEGELPPQYRVGGFSGPTVRFSFAFCKFLSYFSLAFPLIFSLKKMADQRPMTFADLAAHSSQGGPGSSLSLSPSVCFVRCFRSFLLTFALVFASGAHRARHALPLRQESGRARRV